MAQAMHGCSALENPTGIETDYRNGMGTIDLVAAHLKTRQGLKPPRTRSQPIALPDRCSALENPTGIETSSMMPFRSRPINVLQRT